MNRTFLLIVFLLTLLPLIYFPNPGHDALLIPFNIFLWEIAAASICFAGLYIYKHQVLVLPCHTLLILALPVGMVVSGFITGLDRPVDWMFRLATILMGLLFFFSLFQFQANRRTLDNAVYVILGGLLLNGVIAFLQTLPGRPLFGLIAHPETPRAVGVFMQPNILASVMVTGAALSLYQLSTPGFSRRSLLLKTLTFATLFACSFIVMTTGSRVGLIALVLSVPLVVAARFTLLRRTPIKALLAVALLVLGTGSGIATSDGFWKATSKLEQLADEGRDARPHLYRIAWDLYTDKPLAGHGIGSFQRVFHDRAAEYLEARGGEPLIGHARFTHPHNELLFWAVEGGSLALLGIVAILGATLMQLYRLGWQRGGAMLAILLPITLHTQVELPFYSSMYHWLLFLFLGFLVFRPLQRYRWLNWPSAALIPIPAATTALLLATVMFCTTTFGTSRDLTRFLLYKEINLDELRAAQDNLYFNEFATMLTLKALLNQDLTQGTQHWTQIYIDWIETYLRHTPETSSFHDLALAYHHLGMTDKAEATIERGLYLFPQHPVISSTYQKLEEREPLRATSTPEGSQAQ